MIRRAMLTWGVFVVIGMANAATRQTTYGPHVDELSAHQISTATFSGGALLATYLLMGKTVAGVGDRTLLVLGGVWALATIGFEFGLGHYVLGDAWSTLLHDYNVAAGRVWPAVPLTMLFSPVVVKRQARWTSGHRTSASAA